ncbi:hypothetical protein RB595_003859 [Gaeumannomyces hyphopodioides]
MTSGTKNVDLLPGTIAPFVVALPFVVIRVYTASFILRRWAWADTLLVASVVFAVVCTGTKVAVAEIYTKGPRGDWLVDNILLIYKLIGLVTFPCLVISTALAKASVALHLLNFVSTRTMKMLLYMTLGAVATYSVAIIGCSVACTVTVRGLGDVLLGNKNAICVYAIESYIAGGLLNSLTDSILLILPIWILKPLQMKLSRKLTLLPILMAGGFVLGMSLVRLRYSWRLRAAGSSVQSWKESSTWNNLEIWVGIICCCLSSLGPLYRRVAKRVSYDVSGKRPEILVTSTLTTVVSGPSCFPSKSDTFAMHSVGVEEERRYTRLGVPTQDVAGMAGRSLGKTTGDRQSEAAGSCQDFQSQLVLTPCNGSVVASCSRSSLPSKPLPIFPQSRQ